MRRKYLLSDKEFWIEVISFENISYNPIYADYISASGLKKYIKSTQVNEIFITSTLPNVYIQANDRLFLLSYRPFLSFLSNLYEIEDCVKLNWMIDGF